MKWTVKDEPFATGYLDCDSEVLAKKIAFGLYRQAEEMPLSFHMKWKLAGLNRFDREVTKNQGVFFSYGRGIGVQPALLEEKMRLHPEQAQEYKLFLTSFHDSEATVIQIFTPQEQRLIKQHALWGGQWIGHCNIDFGSFVHLGTDGIREKIAKYRHSHPEAAEWYDALEKTMDAVDVLAARYRKLAVEQAKTANPEEKRILNRITQALQIVPKSPPNDFFSAVQSFFLIYTFDGVDSPGRFDQYMGDYYDSADPKEAIEILEGLWIAFHDMRAWNLCIGGSDQDYNDQSNALSYAILDITKRMGFQTPNLTLRWHKNLPDSLLKSAVECIATGNGLPALYNDEVVCPALEGLGIPPKDSHDYAINGCNQIDIQGKSHMGLEDGEINLLKCLEYALFNGVDLKSGLFSSIETGEASCFKSYNEVWEAFKKQVEFAVKTSTDMANRCQKRYSEVAPNPLRSALVQGCIEKGRDYSAGGPIYGHGQILEEGLADAADSLTAIRRHVFEKHEFTMAQLLEMLKADYEGYEEERQRLLNDPCKFGNDIDEADQTAADVQNLLFTELMNYHTWRGGNEGIYGGGCSTFNRAAANGRDAGASANGRHSGDPNIADCIGATPGFDRSGPTAALCSVLKCDQSLAKSGHVMQLKFDKKMFAAEDGIAHFIDLVKGYFNAGGQQLQINVLSREELLDARAHPEKHQNLIVRVGGYSDYFTRLSDELQEHILARTEHNI